MTPEALKAKHPFRMLVAGSSGTGKTTFVREFLRDFRSTTDIPANKLNVFWYHGQQQSIFEVPVSREVNISYFQGFNDEFENQRPHVIVIDDLMQELGDDPRLSALFTKTSHHLSISVIMMTQNLFHHGREMRTVSLNAQIITAMNNPRDRMQLQHLGRQIFPGRSKFFNQVLTNALSEPFSHLMIDISPHVSDDCRLKQRVCVKGVPGFAVYQPK